MRIHASSAGDPPSSYVRLELIHLFFEVSIISVLERMSDDEIGKATVEQRRTGLKAKAKSFPVEIGLRIWTVLQLDCVRRTLQKKFPRKSSQI